MLRAVDRVRFNAIPPDIATQDEQARAIFRFFLGRVYPVAETYLLPRTGILLRVLDVSADIDHRFGAFMNDIRVEDEYLDVVSPPAPESRDAR